MRRPCFAKNCPDARRASLRHLDENAFMIVRDHYSAANEVTDYCNSGVPSANVNSAVAVTVLDPAGINPEPTP